MLYEAAFWRPDVPRPPLEVALSDSRLARYLADWGRHGDMALVAEGSGTEPLGAAWYRLLHSTEPGYGYVSAAVPEITIAVLVEYRRLGYGSALLAALVEEARQSGFDALSLSVEPDNPAVRLYSRLGFEPVGHAVDALTMIRRL